MSQKKNTTKRSKPVQRSQGLVKAFKGVTEVLVTDANSVGSPPLLVQTASGSTQGDLQFTLGPRQIICPQFTTNGSAVSINAYTVETCHLPWLQNTATNFKEYRVLRAVARLIPENISSSSTGKLMMISSKDYQDCLNASVPSAVSQMAGGRTISCAQLVSKDFRVPLTVDSNWKVVTSNSATALNSGTKGVLIATSSINDMSFTNGNVYVTGFSQGTVACSVAVEYDVEFRGPISSSVNQ